MRCLTCYAFCVLCVMPRGVHILRCMHVCGAYYVTLIMSLSVDVQRVLCCMLPAICCVVCSDLDVANMLCVWHAAC